jgi:hypothetical protein
MHLYRIIYHFEPYIGKVYRPGKSVSYCISFPYGTLGTINITDRSYIIPFNSEVAPMTVSDVIASPRFQKVTLSKMTIIP